MAIILLVAIKNLKMLPMDQREGCYHYLKRL
jgi:hypothetical protein